MSSASFLNLAQALDIVEGIKVENAELANALFFDATSFLRNMGFPLSRQNWNRVAESIRTRFCCSRRTLTLRSLRCAAVQVHNLGGLDGLLDQLDNFIDKRSEVGEHFDMLLGLCRTRTIDLSWAKRDVLMHAMPTICATLSKMVEVETVIRGVIECSGSQFRLLEYIFEEEHFRQVTLPIQGSTTMGESSPPVETVLADLLSWLDSPQDLLAASNAEVDRLITELRSSEAERLTVDTLGNHVVGLMNIRDALLTLKGAQYERLTEFDRALRSTTTIPTLIRGGPSDAELDTRVALSLSEIFAEAVRILRGAADEVCVVIVS
ncbi:hypothetical protein BV20DRAFT_959368 [Pilatotrama ljubarskyi]|nr:hypothetical protein BV20DRAFT_959368 [Pilatotrama ljubarskyi]